MKRFLNGHEHFVIFTVSTRAACLLMRSGQGPLRARSPLGLRPSGVVRPPARVRATALCHLSFGIGHLPFAVGRASTDAKAKFPPGIPAVFETGWRWQTRTGEEEVLKSHAEV